MSSGGRATANPPWMCRKSACRRLSAGGRFRVGCVDAGNIPRQCPLPHRGAAGTFDKPIPENRKIYFYICISDGVASKRHKDRFPWDAPRSSAGHQNGGQRLAQPHFPRYFDHDEIIILSCRSRSDMPGFYDYLLNEIHVEDAPPLFLKYFPTEACWSCWGPSSSC